MSLFHTLFNRRYELVILNAVIMIGTFLKFIVQIAHWYSLNWQVTGIHPWMPIIVFAVSASFMGVFWIRRIPSIGLWFAAGLGIIWALICWWMLFLSGYNFTGHPEVLLQFI